MKKKKERLIVACEKCGKVPPLDLERCTQWWTAFDTKAPCPCGGKWAAMYPSGAEALRNGKE